MHTLVIWPEIETDRAAALQQVSATLRIVNASTLELAEQAMPTATAFFGKMTPSLLRRAAQLQWIQSPTASLEHYLFPELVEHPCVLTNMRGLFSDVIADHVMGFVLCFARNLHLYLHQQTEGLWAPIGDADMVTDFVSAPGRVSPVDQAHQHLGDLTLGVVGVGQIGQEVGRRAAAFGMRILGVDPIAREFPGHLGPVKGMDHLPELLAESHYVVIAAPHTPQTVKLFDRQKFSQMRPDGILINIGRGAIVDLHDLTIALRDKTIRGAALDVCETEPLPSDHPLWRMPNVIITPHVAAASPRIAERHLSTVVENLRRFLDSEPLLTPVDKHAWF